MALRTDTYDLAGLHLGPGGARRMDLEVAIEPFELAGERYELVDARVPARLDVSRTTGGGYALRLRFSAELTGPCMRCLAAAAQIFAVDAREVSQPGAGEELESPYVTEYPAGQLDLHGWARDALALVLPAQLLCGSQCAGLCPDCGVSLNLAGPAHAHARGADPRWAKLSELRFD